MLGIFQKLFDANQKELDGLLPIVEKINSFEDGLVKLSDEELAAKTPEFKLSLSRGEGLDEIMPEALAVIREAVKRQVNQRAFDVQLLAAISLHKGRVAEQRTGEGKTLSAALSAYVNGLTSKGIHIVTVNDYLARIGTGWYGRALTMLGLKVACIIHEQAFLYDPNFRDKSQIDDRLAHLNPISRKEAYLADVTYGTNNEFGFDYLRDNLVSDLNEMVQRDPYFAIVDEVDSILIDEARTPLIISAPDTEPTKKYYDFARLISGLSPDTDYSSDEKSKTANLTEHGIRKVEKMLGVDNLYEKDFDTIHHIENALKAKVHFLRDRDYVIKDDQVIIVDEFTGRLMFGRRWSEGLHQAIEAKEGVQIQQESKTLATISFQNYFRMYKKLAGMTGTAATEAEEFKKIYNLDVTVIPTNKPMIRVDHGDVVYKNQRAKYAAIVKEIEECYKKGQPVLVGTTSVAKNEIIDQFLNHKKIPHAVLNAKQHQKEAEIITKAGEKSAVTIATNMAGRGVDIVLGGAMPQKIDFEGEKEYQKAAEAWQEKHDKIISFGGLHVIGTERHESRRIDNQLRGRSGRQGDPGSSRFFVALDDDLMRIFGGDQISSLMTRFNMPEDVPLEHAMVSRSIEQAQVKVEGFNFDMRKQVVEYDDVMNKQREIIYKLRKGALETSGQGTGISEQPKALKEEILEKINIEITNLVAMYSPEGYSGGTSFAYSEPEYEKIILGFVEIVPFDDRSQNQLKEQISKLKGQNTISEFLLKVIEDIYANREKMLGEEVSRQIERYVYLSTIDKLWIDHLTAVDDLRDGIGLRGYAQRDPLVEYKKEAFEMFEKLVNQIDYEVVRKIFRIQVMAQQPTVSLERATEGRGKGSGHTKADDLPTVSSTQPITSQSVGRNDPCPCGAVDPQTGKPKKYKKCCYPKYG
ncbi:preprotein translocase subunit SecA [Candidatus Shapirobacteria bacterium CG07_land_8_20_14_0_80_39_18]|uniref:Protein translocase subunit SecA n=1 Tax=Candidatus Shapirobacteria bacterium CG07_land_8_20_14_0_80_39_18 TaxID=1974882 RepID=A0A2M6YQW8_9BACT|nr:MAG: preprotein translocase subunit SecA [Candidatus Shapirobacteria bacterium CG07_land_8_20_14_0_80_39_18]